MFEEEETAKRGGGGSATKGVPMASNESDLIDQAYEALVKSLFGVFHTSRITAAAAKDPKAAQLEADHAFQRGLAAAKASRDRALQLLDGAAPPIA